MCLFILVTAWVPSNAQTVNSNPDFVAFGRAPYTCITPKKRKVVCNKWHLNPKGWRNLRVTDDALFSKVTDTRAHAIKIPKPDFNRAMLYDGKWADPMGVKEAAFFQHVKITASANYKVTACMAAKFFTDDVPDDTHPYSGVQVILDEWFAAPRRVPYSHVILPNKAMFGPGTLYESASINFSGWVNTEAELPVITEAGAIFGVRDSRTAWIHDGLTWYRVGDSTTQYGIEVDGYLGFAGLTDAYHKPTSNIDATWTCQEAYAWLLPGHYVLRVRVLPVHSQKGNVFSQKHEGVAALRHVSLTRVE
jgi:hypothetical protein